MNQCTVQFRVARWPDSYVRVPNEVLFLIGFDINGALVKVKLPCLV